MPKSICLGYFWLFFRLCWSAVGRDQSFVHLEEAQLRQGQLTALCSCVATQLRRNSQAIPAITTRKYDDAIPSRATHNQRWQDWNRDIACSYSSVTSLDMFMWDMINVCKLTWQPAVCYFSPKARLAKYFSPIISSFCNCYLVWWGASLQHCHWVCCSH